MSEELEPIQLSPQSKASETPATAPQIADPWAVDEAEAAKEAEAATTEEAAATEENGPPSDAAEALSKLKFSSQRLASNLDSKLGLSSAFGMLGNSVKQIDQKTHVSETVKSAGGAIGNWFSGLDQQFKISQKGKGLGSSISSMVPTDEISAGIQKSTRALQTFDENHGITKTTADTLAGGADFLTNTIAGSDDDGAEAAAPPSDETTEVDGDGLPSSFQ